MTIEAGQTKILATVPAGPSLRFLPLTPALVRAVASDDAFTHATGATLGEQATKTREIVAQSEALRAKTHAPLSWGSFLVADRSTGAVVGTCSFTNAPDQNGAVEIAYFTFPGFERKGIATTMARHLVDHARARSDAKLVLAHTLPEEGASPRVLRRLGFAARGTARDPDAGEVWRFELAFEREDEARIFRMERAALLEWCQGNPSGFLSICADDVSYFDPHTQNRIDGLAALTDYFEKIRGKMRADRFEIAAPRIVRSRDLTILTFHFTSYGGSENATAWNVTEAYRRDAEGHRLVHTHWSVTKT